MTIRVALHHQTTYQYDRSIELGPQLVRLRPAYHARTKIESYSLCVEPDQHFVNWQQDPFGNPIARFVFPKPCRELRIAVDLVAEMTVINPFDFFILESADQWPFRYEASLKSQLAPYLCSGDGSSFLDRWIAKLPKASDSIVDFLVAVNQRVNGEIRYLVRLEPGVQTPEETLTLKSGSCRDSAWLLVEVFRKLGIAARFVSGYLIQLKPDEIPENGPVGPVADFCDLHAWTEVYLPGAGWVGLDPTSGLFAGEGHIPLACTPSYLGAAPISGSHEQCEVEFSHEMSVTRFHEDARVSKPYSEDEWQAVLASGQDVEKVLEREDVRLTMGGEPTFVSMDNAEDPQWNTDAVGEEKRVLSNLLLLKLRDQFAPGGLLHYGQGKWYPGESLPRWALSCIWRRDGLPIWNDIELLADEGREYGYSIQDAEDFIRHLTHELGVESKMSFPVYEDTFHYLWREDRLPVDVDPLDPDLDDPNERSMLVRTFTSGLGKPVGFVLPIRRAWWQAEPGWIAGRWPVRSGSVYLVPGDSPIGLRLPMESLPSGLRSETELSTTPLDPTVRRTPFGVPDLDEDTPSRIGASSEGLAQVEGSIHSNSDQQSFRVNSQVIDEGIPNETASEPPLVRTALCVECRHGRLHVFMPPMQRAEDYLELVQSVEQTCKALSKSVIIEGYLPPPDDRLELFKVTPDPGVIEVNTHPTGSWNELVKQTEVLYEEARKCGLGTSKFDLDGRHTGTGGGSHVVLGGRMPLDSPFLRRPELLASVISFWNNHPSMSYLFSGKFIGPTSQAPRLDESRADAIYEMEIALAQLPESEEAAPPWLVDRLFRDLLTDLTGNTHRAEICIDKLYSPDSSTGRLGLVEFRGFEMPAHPQMNLAQQLLLRAAVAKFWQEPCFKKRLSDWQGVLHDRFMLPFFVWEDFAEVIQSLSCDEFQLDKAWYLPHFNARFPEIGEVSRGGVRVKLRSAIEPWYVMGEDPGGGGTVRFVDSSLERIEILVEGFDAARHQIWCNGVSIPMHPTGTPGRHVAGVRYRAWQPPRCLHPTIPVHAPVRVEVIDVPNALSLGGCTYHVMDPGGRATERFPVNANEAEARRASRFEELGGSGGRVSIQPPAVHSRKGLYPITTDLRRFSPNTEVDTIRWR